jgi:hypothetical protein
MVQPSESAKERGALPDLGLPLDTVSFIILKAREYDVKEADSDPDDGSNPALLGAIDGLRDDQKARLVALAWLGRGTYALDEWADAVATARREHNARAAQYLLGLPLLGDYLEDGLAMFDEFIVDQDDTREGLNSEDEPLGNMRDKPKRQ